LTLLLSRAGAGTKAWWAGGSIRTPICRSTGLRSSIRPRNKNANLAGEGDSGKRISPVDGARGGGGKTVSQPHLFFFSGRAGAAHGRGNLEASWKRQPGNTQERRPGASGVCRFGVVRQRAAPNFARTVSPLWTAVRFSAPGGRRFSVETGPVQTGRKEAGSPFSFSLRNSGLTERFTMAVRRGKGFSVFHEYATVWATRGDGVVGYQKGKKNADGSIRAFERAIGDFHRRWWGTAVFGLLEKVCSSSCGALILLDGHDSGPWAPSLRPHQQSSAIVLEAFRFFCVCDW